MELVILMLTAGSAVVEIRCGGIYSLEEEYTLLLNGETWGTAQKVVTSLFGLCPDRDYRLQLAGADGRIRGEVCFHTEAEAAVLNVRDFGASGDGEQDDTVFIQAAVMACPKSGRVRIPRGKYRVTSLFLKSDLNLELEEGAVLLYDGRPGRLPVLPGHLSGEGAESFSLGSWEGEAADMYAALFTGCGVENVNLYGRGCIQGGASMDNWWKQENRQSTPHRPKMLYLTRCTNIRVHGLHFSMCPSWCIHPCFCRDLGFYDIEIRNPENSPNTDGLNPESCECVDIAGCHFSLGDDCIAIKSGKGKRAQDKPVPGCHITIRQCFMENGHGGVTIGSEISSGIHHVTVRDCRFRHTDRGLRIKTRRGRGKACVVDDVLFENICMEEVETPFVLNCYYSCEPDGRSDYVQSKEALPVDARTPCVGNLVFRHIYCTDCHIAGAFFYGLPEKKIKSITMEDVRIRYAAFARAGLSAMMCGIPEMRRTGLFFRNVERLSLSGIDIRGQETEAVDAVNVDIIVREDGPQTGGTSVRPVYADILMK